MSIRPLEQIVTKIAGTMSGPDAKLRQASLQELAAVLAAGQHVVLELIPEPENPFDGDAVRVECVLPFAGRTQLGFVKNSSGICDRCHQSFERFPKRCPGCRHTDFLRRDGAATRIAQALRACPTLTVYAEVLEVTGGSEEKCYGCNILVKPLYRPLPAPLSTEELSPATGSLSLYSRGVPS